MVGNDGFSNRSRVLDAAIKDRIERLRRECAKLDRAEEQALADEEYIAEIDWRE